jgi:hypothetical protein
MFEFVWRNKWLTADAHSLADMADKLDAAANQLREMHRAGVTLANGDDIADDYAYLVTADPVVAERFGFHEPVDLDEEGDEFDDDEELDEDCALER